MKANLKNYCISIILMVITVVVKGCRIMPSNASNQVNTSYSESFDNFPNPERGFYIDSGPTANTPISLSRLKEARNQNLSLVRRLYSLSEFRSSSLSQSFLDLVSKDLQIAREAGVKLIIRFVYNWKIDGYDADKNRILSHIEQLKPVLNANKNAIAYLDAGFIGAWGEWHSSTHNLHKSTDDMRDILFKLLSVVPYDRMVALRYPHHKQKIYNNENSLISSEAFNYSYRSRTGSHNDCFLADYGDRGTYELKYGVQIQKDFLSQDNLYVVQGGETCSSDSEAQPYIGCDNALSELSKMRWSALNSEFEQGVLQTWKEQGCFTEIERRLGYRFKLVNSEITKVAKPGHRFFAKLNIKNVGWASPYNPRLLEIVLRNRGTSQEYYLQLDEDPRRWFPGDTVNINIEGGLPGSIASGEYDIFLNLPDSDSKLYNQPEYSIRLANIDVWDDSTGYNSLLSSISINNNAEGENYSGSNYFVSR